MVSQSPTPKLTKLSLSRSVHTAQRQSIHTTSNNKTHLRMPFTVSVHAPTDKKLKESSHSARALQKSTVSNTLSGGNATNVRLERGQFCFGCHRLECCLLVHASRQTSSAAAKQIKIDAVGLLSTRDVPNRAVELWQHVLHDKGFHRRSVLFGP